MVAKNMLMRMTYLARGLARVATSCIMMWGAFAAHDARADTSLNYRCSGSILGRFSGTLKFESCLSPAGEKYLCPVGTTYGTGGLVRIGRDGNFNFTLGGILAPEISHEAPIQICNLHASKTGQTGYQLAELGGWGNCAIAVEVDREIFLMANASTTNNTSLMCNLTFKRD
jgi:hypothetical protein